MKTLIYVTLIAICKQKGIDEDDAISVLENSMTNNLNPVDEIKKAFWV